METWSKNAVPCEACKCHWDSFMGEFGGAFMDRDEADTWADLLELIQ